MANVEVDAIHPGGLQCAQHQCLDFDIAFQPGVTVNLRAYLQAFSPAVRDIFESFDFHTQIDRLGKCGLLYLVTEKFANIDLHPAVVTNALMGAVFARAARGQRSAQARSHSHSDPPTGATAR